jgi:hypothetical protein
MPKDLITQETENTPAMEVHLGEINNPMTLTRQRHCIIWLNGKRWEGDLLEVQDG